LNLNINDSNLHTIALTLNPNGSYGPWTQLDASYTIDVNTTVHTFSQSQAAPVFAYLTGLSPDDSRDWRCMISGQQWPALSLSRASTLLIDPCSALTHWTGGAHTTLSLSGGVKATVAGGVGSLTLAVPSGVRVWEVYRYLQISGLFDPGGSTPVNLTLTVSMAGQTWDLVLGHSGSAQVLDLCCATHDTSTVNATQSRFPISGTGGFPINTDPTNAYEMGWGVNFCDSITISGIPDGYTVTLTDVSLVSSGSGSAKRTITFLENFLNFINGWTSGSDTTTVQPWLGLACDGRPLDMPAKCLVTPTGAGSPSYTDYSISQIQTILAYFPGLTATLLADLADGYHTSGQYALFLGGEGATYDHTGHTWKDWVDVDLPQTSIPAQDLWDEIQSYPGAGDVFDPSAAYGGATPIRISKSLRGQGVGMVFSTDGSALASAPVKLFETASPSIGEGSGSSDGIGFYQTGTPWAFGNVDTTSDLNLAPMPHLSSHGVIQNRQRYRASFRHDRVTTSSLGYDVSNSVRHVRTYANSGSGTIGMRTAGNVLPQTWSDVDTGLSGTWARPRFQDHGVTWPIGLFYGDGTTCTFAQTLDEGVTFFNSTSMGGGLVGDFEEGANGLRWFYKVQDDTGVYNVYNKVLDSQFNVVRNWTITNVTGIDNAPLACRESPVADGSWRIGLFYTVGGVETILFSKDGLTFS
jgi:hypothetical protein